MLAGWAMAQIAKCSKDQAMSSQAPQEKKQPCFKP